MKKLIIAVALAALLLPSLALAQVCNFDMRFDPQSVTAITGTVLTTIDYNPGNPAAGPRAVAVQSQNQIYTVFLGPGWFINQIGLNLNPGDRITVTGSLRSLVGRTYIVASTVRTPIASYSIRTQAGLPLWSRGGTVIPPVGGGPVTGPFVPFNPNRMVIEQGRIIRIEQARTAESTSPLVVAVLQPTDTSAREVRVLLGPANVLSQSGFRISRGQQLWVRGSSVEINGRPYVVATSIAQGSVRTDLRNMTGIPVWIGYVPPAGTGPGVTPDVPFNPAQMVTVTGEIRSISYLTNPLGGSPLVMVNVGIVGTTSSVRVLLGPQDLMQQSGFQFRSGNLIWVRGSAVTINNQPTVVATQVVQDNRTLNLRSSAGIPLWTTGTGLPTTTFQSPSTTYAVPPPPM